MKKLTLTGTLQGKINRLPKGVSQLHYLGINPNNFSSKLFVAVVGTRKPTPYGIDTTERIVTDLVREGAVIVSGLAFGVDITAHKAALKAGGQTIAVLPSGVNNIYPATHRNIAKQITESGCLISEYPASHHPRKVEFLERNRIIATLSDAVIVPEAAERSGSLNTTGHANKMDIPVFAVPGRSIDLMSAGTNHLIKTGEGRLVTSAQDILKSLNIKPAKTKKVPKGNDTHETAVLVALQSGINDTTLLQSELRMNTAKLQTVLTMLEINGQAAQNALGQWHIT